MAKGFEGYCQSLLEETGCRVFERMLLEKVAFPLGLGEGHKAVQLASEGRRKHVKRMLWRLTQTRTYQIALSKPASQRYSIDGESVAMVSPLHRQEASETIRKWTQEGAPDHLGGR